MQRVVVHSKADSVSNQRPASIDPTTKGTYQPSQDLATIQSRKSSKQSPSQVLPEVTNRSQKSIDEGGSQDAYLSK